MACLQWRVPRVHNSKHVVKVVVALCGGLMAGKRRLRDLFGKMTSPASLPHSRPMGAIGGHRIVEAIRTPRRRGVRTAGVSLGTMTNLIALHSGTELVGDYRIDRVLGAGGFGITYLADEIALARLVTIKEYFPSDFAARESQDASPRSKECTAD